MMPGTLATAIETAARRVRDLEHSLRIYRDGFPAAAEKIAAQLDAAYADLAELEARQ